MSSTSRVQICLLTPRGRGAVATIGLRGPRVAEFVAARFRPQGARPLDPLDGSQLRVGRWRDADGEEVVVCFPKRDQAEIHCHGGRAAATAILDDLAALGCDVIDWSTWLQSASRDLVASEAHLALAETSSERAARVLLDQLQGALLRTAGEIDELVADGTAASLDTAGGRLARLAELSPLGLHLASCWRVVVAGPPNVGKSSLINALVGYERSLVFDRPGTTRDLVTATTAIDGWPVELVDTAGLRVATDLLEKAGIDRAREQLAVCDLLIVVVDAREATSDELASLAAAYPRALFVANKIDLCPDDSTSPAAARHATIAPHPPLPVSALVGQGLRELLAAISARLVPGPPRAGEAVPFTSRHLEAIDDSLASLHRRTPWRSLHDRLAAQTTDDAGA